MDKARWDQLESLFHDAIGRGPSERAQMLDQLRATDAELAGELDALLAGHEDSTGFLTPIRVTDQGGSLAVEAGTDDLVGLRHGHRIGAYTIGSPLGSGGMGVVYEARQDSPSRPVALKVMSRGIVSARARHRFSYEAEALGKLHHPGIAQVYEAGVHEPMGGGLPVPYFAMELVEGAKTIIAYASELPQRGRLALFEQLCDAVDHGHRAGVIHRDLKPANVLVDRNGRVKIIDFGVARLAEPEETSPFTTMQTVGTPQYMAPEQMTALPVDARADVYALGMLLFELLTGKLPYSIKGLSLPGAARVIERYELADPSRNHPELRGDLAAIIVKALAKDPGARYSSAAQLRDDIARLERGEPVTARPLTLRYQASVLARRHRTRILVAGVVGAAVLLGSGAGVVGLVVGYTNARRAEAEALASADRATQTADILRAMIMQANPKNGRGEPTMRNAIDEARLWLDEGPERPPLVEYDVREALAQAYWTLGEYDWAQKQFARAVELGVANQGYNDVSVQMAALGQGRIIISGGDAEGAYRVIEPFLDHARGAARVSYLCLLADIQGVRGEHDAAMETIGLALERSAEVNGPESQAYGETLGAACETAAFACDLDASVVYGSALVELYEGPLSADRLTRDLVRAQLASTLQLRAGPGDLGEAERLLRTSIATLRVYASDTMDYAWASRQLGHVLLKQGRVDEAVAQLRDARLVTEAVVGVNHHQTETCWLGLARALRASGATAEAESWYERAAMALERRLGPEHPEVIDAMEEWHAQPDEG